MLLFSTFFLKIDFYYNFIHFFIYNLLLTVILFYQFVVLFVVHSFFSFTLVFKFNSLILVDFITKTIELIGYWKTNQKVPETFKYLTNKLYPDKIRICFVMDQILSSMYFS